MSLYFKKENLRNPVFGPDKKAVQFQPIAGDAGVIMLDETKDAAVIAVLNGCADKRQLGVVRISGEIFDALKKNEASAPSRQPSRLNQIRVSPSPASFNSVVKPAAASPAAAVGRNAPIRVMEEDAPPSSISEFRQRSLRSRPLNPPEPQR